ncbi:uncharacterized protein LOC119991133 isoform X2 [Tripterygium wilfordii]|uniref:uncharacterized protein LOC119991133 isoform X2 n=1 Tax=Tripterygium wilfordii TaxID=458696 RepID=UPI0018F85B3C|nr:uncharacterized protein LOC119991133 isoform X2 [Tripterygium wilfordii]
MIIGLVILPCNFCWVAPPWCLNKILFQSKKKKRKSISHLSSFASEREGLVKDFFQPNRHLLDYEMSKTGKLILSFLGFALVVLRRILIKSQNMLQAFEGQLFSVNSYCIDLIKESCHHSNTYHAWHSVWSSTAPLQVAFFCWEAIWERILAIVKLLRRGALDDCLEYSGDKLGNKLQYWR